MIRGRISARRAPVLGRRPVFRPSLLPRGLRWSDRLLKQLPDGAVQASQRGLEVEVTRRTDGVVSERLVEERIVRPGGGVMGPPRKAGFERTVVR